MSPKDPSPTGKMCMKVLSKLGYELDRQSGSHKIFKKDGKGIPVVLATHKDSSEIPPGTFSSVLRSMGITPIEFYALLRGEKGSKGTELKEEFHVQNETENVKVVPFKAPKKRRQRKRNSS